MKRGFQPRKDEERATRNGTIKGRISYLTLALAGGSVHRIRKPGVPEACRWDIDHTRDRCHGLIAEDSSDPDAAPVDKIDEICSCLQNRPLKI